MEKAVDQVIGHRQKHKGMGWRPQGSRALALLKVLELIPIRFLSRDTLAIANLSLL